MLDNTQQEWLYLFTRGKAPATYNAPVEVESRKKVENDDIRVRALKITEMGLSVEAVAAVKENLKKGLTHTTEVDGKKISTKGSQDKALDLEEIKKAKSIETMKDTTVASKMAIAMMIKEQTRLKRLTVKRWVWDEKTGLAAQDTVRLFDDDDIMRDFYTPMVREELVPETFVPSEYSATQKMIDGSNDPYIEECRSKGKEPERGLADLGKGVVNFSASMATAFLGTSTDAALITEGIALAIGVGIDGIDMMVEWKEDGFNPESLANIGDKVAQSVGKLVSGATGSDNTGTFIGGIVAGGARALVGSARVGDWVKNRLKGSTDDFPFGDLLDDFLKGAGGAMGSLSGKDQGGASVNDTIAQQIFVKLGDIIKSVDVEKLKKLPPSKWGPAFGRLMVTVVISAEQAAGTIMAAETKKQIDDKVVNPAEEKIKEAEGKIKEAEAKVEEAKKDPTLPEEKIQELENELKDAKETQEKVKTEQEEIKKGGETGKREADLVAEKAEEDIKKQLEAAMEVLGEESDDKKIEQAQERIQKEKEAYRKSLDRLGDMGDEGTPEDFKSIAKLIAKLQRDQKILAMATALSTASAVLVGELFAPLKAAGALVQFMANLHSAIEACQAWLAWRDSHDEASLANSPYATSIANFVKNQGDQFTHATIQAALKLLQAASATAENGYPPLKALTVAAQASAALEDTIYQFKRKTELRAAWKVTKAALSNPKNRKAGLVARKMNPTLAKYTIAYGAVVEQSPIAITAMNRCGLDRETLSRANSNVKEVKDYLQTLYKDDGILLGPIPVEGKTSLPQPTLTVRSWTMTLSLWTKESDLVSKPPRNVRLLLGKFETLNSVNAKPEDVLEHFKELHTTLTELSKSYESFVPVDSGGSPLVGSDRVVSIYADLAYVQAELAEQEVARLTPDKK